MDGSLTPAMPVKVIKSELRLLVAGYKRCHNSNLRLASPGVEADPSVSECGVLGLVALHHPAGSDRADDATRGVGGRGAALLLGRAHAPAESHPVEPGGEESGSGPPGVRVVTGRPAARGDHAVVALLGGGVAREAKNLLTGKVVEDHLAVVMGNRNRTWQGKTIRKTVSVSALHRKKLYITFKKIRKCRNFK